ncbi:MAG: hypothetical protein ACLU38_11785 [Dysosmobacter sp.]
MVSLVVINIIAFLIALALTQKMRGTNIFRTVFFMPSAIGGIVAGPRALAAYRPPAASMAAYSTASKSLNEWYGFAGLAFILVSWQQIRLYDDRLHRRAPSPSPAMRSRPLQIDDASGLNGFIPVKVLQVEEAESD